MAGLAKALGEKALKDQKDALAALKSCQSKKFQLKARKLIRGALERKLQPSLLWSCIALSKLISIVSFWAGSLFLELGWAMCLDWKLITFENKQERHAKPSQKMASLCPLCKFAIEIIPCQSCERYVMHQ